MSKKSTKNRDAIKVFNYCLGFIDLLGQRDLFSGQGLLPTIISGNGKKIDKTKIIESIGAIYRLQEDADKMLKGLTERRPDSPLRKRLSTEQKELWDEMQLTRITKQRWSDGFVAFVCLGDRDVKCPMNGIYSLFAWAGVLCLLGLVSRQPIRGSIDIAWGVELHPGELYGPVVARAYELESEIAQYPRIVVGNHVVDFLMAHQNESKPDVFSQFNKTLSDSCLKMLIRDVDGVFILHYLGNEFRDSVTKTDHQHLFDMACAFVADQLKLHQDTWNSKLAFRYANLMHYFETHRP